MATYTWDAIYDRLKVDQGGLPNKSTQDMLDTFWTLAGYPDGTLGADAKVAFYESQGAIGDSLGDLEYDYWYRVGPNILAAKGAVFAIDAAQSISGEQWALNRGSGGQMLRAKYGSVARAEIRNGVGLVLPGTVGNRGEVADQASLEIGGDLDVRVQVALDSWTGANVDLCGKMTDASNFGYGLSLLTTGELRLYWSTTGSDYPFATSTVATGVANGAAKWVRATIDVDNGASGRDIKFYLSDDGVTWTQLGATGTQAGATSIYTSGTSFFAVGVGSGVGVPSAGRFMRTQVLNGIGGTTVLDIDFTAQADLTSSFVASTGQTVTVTAANAVDTNDPLRLPWNGENYVYFPGANNNSITTTGSLSDFPTNGVQVEVDIDYGSSAWTSRQGIFWFAGTAAGSSRSVEVSTWATGGFLLTYGDGVVASDYAIFSASPLTGRQRWRFTADAATPARIYTAEYWNGSGWTVHQIQTDTDATAVAAIDSITNQPIIGSTNSTPTGRIYSVDVRDGALASLFNWRASDMTQTGGVSGGRTWTVNRASSGRKTAVVTRPIWLFGTDDYLEVADNDLLDFAANESYTLVVVARVFGTYTNNAYAAKKVSNGVTAGYALHYESGGATLFHSPSDGTLYPFVGTARPASGALAAVVAVRDVSADQNIVYVNGATASVTDTTTATLANAQPFRVSGWGAGGGPLDMELLAVGIFRRALSATEIAQIVTYYGAS